MTAYTYSKPTTMSADGFTPVTDSSRREHKRASRARRDILRNEFNATEWPRLCRERAAACKAKFELYQARLLTETKEAYAGRIKKAIDSALKKYEAFREELFDTYCADVAAREASAAETVEGGGATLMPMPTALRAALPLPEETPVKVRPPKTKAEPAHVAVGVVNSFAALAEDSSDE